MEYLCVHIYHHHHASDTLDLIVVKQSYWLNVDSLNTAVSYW